MPTNEKTRMATRWFYHINKENSKKAWQFHDSIFANQQAFATDSILTVKEIATLLGFDADKMEKAIEVNKKELDALIDLDIQEAKKMDFSGTPYFIVNNVTLRGSQPIQIFENAITFTNEKK